MGKTKSKILGLLLIVFGSTLTACGNNAALETETNDTNIETEISTEREENEQTTEATEQAAETSENTEEVMENKNSHILIAYFTRLPNTENGEDLDVVVQGGGPYGAIGDSYENADIDAISSASITIVDGIPAGNTQYMAEWIEQSTGGTLFQIETVEKYPLDYETLIDQGGEEKQQQIRPELSSHVENMEDYDIIFLGFPNWYYDMPMAVYSFLEEYDFSGKTVIPFCSSAGSGFSGTIDSLQEILPDADVLSNGLALNMREVAGAREQVEDWIETLEITE